MSITDATSVSDRRDIHLTRAPEGYDALALVQLLRDQTEPDRAATLVHVARDDRRLDALEKTLGFSRA